MTSPTARYLERPSMTATVVSDREIWDPLVERLGGRLLQTWRWGDFKERHGWDAVRLLVSADTPSVAGQILFRRIGPFTVGYLPRGPVGAVSDPDAMAAWSVALDRIARSRRCIAVLADPETPIASPAGPGELGWRRDEGVLIQPARTIKLRIDACDDELLARMKPKTRYNVRLAERRGVQVRHCTASDLPAFFELLRETGERDEFGLHRVEYYGDLLAVFDDAAALLMAEYEGEPAAGIIVVRAGDEAIYMFGASAGRLQRHMPAYLIQFEAMRWARSLGCRLYDLWGIPSEDEPPPDATGGSETVNVRHGMWGVFRFKQGFGGEVFGYPGVYERVYRRPLMRLWRLYKPNLL